MLSVEKLIVSVVRVVLNKEPKKIPVKELREENRNKSGLHNMLVSFRHMKTSELKAYAP